MSSNSERSSTGSTSYTADSKNSGTTIDPGPYVATVIKHVEGSRMGQLLVYIPDWGDDLDDPDSQTTVSYASPFYGTTYGTDTQLLPDSANTVGQSYGMWFVPPDIGCQVLVTFVAGSRDRGYWFACVYNSSSHHMVPGMARNIGGSENTTAPTDSPVTSYLGPDSILPVVESSTASPKAFDADGLEKTPRYFHEYQSSLLIGQGLDRDKVRGAISSSSLRESPSNVYGISTPGRKATTTDQIKDNPQQVIMRKGGHQFVMDDGSAADGTDQLIRLRTSAGHQILMNDTEQVFYIGSASGYHWMEFSNNGMINMYGYAGFNLRTVGALNLHSDTLVNIHSGGAVNIQGSKGVNISSLASVGISGMTGASLKTNGFLSITGMATTTISSGGPLTIGSPSITSIVGLGMLKLNSGKPPIPIPVVPTMPKELPDVQFGGTRWELQDGAVESICTVVPCHEPWQNSDGTRPGPDGGGNNALKNIVIGGSLAALGVGISNAISSIQAASAASSIASAGFP